MKKFYILTIFLFITLLSVVILSGQEFRTRNKIEKIHTVSFILDASGSMNDKLGKKQKETKFDVSLEIIRQCLIKSRKYYTMFVVFGGKNNSLCNSSRVVLKLNKYEKIGYTNLINKVISNIKTPAGFTPIAKSMLLVKNELEKFQDRRAEDGRIEKYNNKLILISDGRETCDGNPSGVKKKMKKAEIIKEVIVFGIATHEEKTIKQYKSIADKLYIVGSTNTNWKRDLSTNINKLVTFNK